MPEARDGISKWVGSDPVPCRCLPHLQLHVLHLLPSYGKAHAPSAQLSIRQLWRGRDVKEPRLCDANARPDRLEVP